MPDFTITKDRSNAHEFATHEAAAHWAAERQGSRGGLPISWRVQGMIDLIGGRKCFLIALPGIVDQYVAKLPEPQADNSVAPLGPEYGQSFGQNIDLVSDLIKALQQCDPQAAVRIQVHNAENLRSVRNVKDTATTTGHPLVMIRSY